MKERRVIEYKTVVHNKPEELDREVNDLIIQGWELHGHPYATVYRLCQALVRYEGRINHL